MEAGDHAVDQIHTRSNSKRGEPRGRNIPRLITTVKPILNVPISVQLRVLQTEMRVLTVKTTESNICNFEPNQIS